MSVLMPLRSSVNPPLGRIRVPETMMCVPFNAVSPAGLNQTAEPSAQGLAAETPPRPIVQIPSSLTARPWAWSAAGIPASSNSNTERVNRCIRVSPESNWGDGGTGCDTVALAPMLVKPARARASALFRATFDTPPAAAASAPGRVNLIGEHTDYNGGPVLPIALAQRTVVAAGPGEPGVLEAVSERDGRVWRHLYKEGRAADWPAYVAGVVTELHAAGLLSWDTGVRVAVASDVPVGAGLSSSAALTVAA